MIFRHFFFFFRVSLTNEAFFDIIVKEHKDGGRNLERSKQFFKNRAERCPCRI